MLYFCMHFDIEDTLMYDRFAALGGTLFTDQAELTGRLMVVTPVSIRVTITIVASLPILMIYPFLQKHFVHGLQLGNVKE